MDHVKALSCIKPYQCGYCQVSYHANTKLLSHVKVHKLFLFVPFADLTASKSGIVISAGDTDAEDEENSLSNDDGDDDDVGKIGQVKIELEESDVLPVSSENTCKEENTFIESAAVGPSNPTADTSLSNTSPVATQWSSNHKDSHDQPGNDMLLSTAETQQGDWNHLAEQGPGSSDGDHGENNITNTEQTDSCQPSHPIKHKSEGTAAKLDNPPNFQCGECEAVFKSAPKITAHWNAHHSSCTVCGEHFSDPRYRHKHFKKKHGVDTVPDKPFLCALCGDKFSVARYILDHVRHRHMTKKKKKKPRLVPSQVGPPRFKCGECDALFPSVSCLSEHWQSQHSTCSDCGVCFSEPQELYQHFTTNHSRVSDKPFWCAICGAKYPVARYVTDHVRRCHKRPKHSGPPVHSTSACRHGESKGNSLMCSSDRNSEGEIMQFTAHGDTGPANQDAVLNPSLDCDPNSSHPGQGLTDKHKEQDYKCGECGASFTSAPVVAAHWKSCHSTCTICEKRFDDPRNRQDHFTTKHDMDTVPSKPFLCAVCGARYPVARYVTDHIRRCHKSRNSSGQTHEDDTQQQAESGVAGNSRKPNSLKSEQDAASRHRKQNYLCGECDAVFRSPPTLSEHWRSHHGACATCGECFAHPGDRRQHFIAKHDIDTLPERPFLCALCGATFSVIACLRNHILKLHPRQEVADQTHANVDIQTSPADKGMDNNFSSTSKTNFEYEDLISNILDANRLADQTSKEEEEVCLFDKRVDQSLSKSETKTALEQPGYDTEMKTALEHHDYNTDMKTVVEQPEYNHQCGECGECFKSAPNLSDHWLSTHQACSLCGDCFYEPYELCQHQEAKHKKGRVCERPYVCAICGMQTAVARYLTAHIDKRHKPRKMLRQIAQADSSCPEHSTQPGKYSTDVSAEMLQGMQVEEKQDSDVVHLQITDFIQQAKGRAARARDKSGICPTCGKRVKDVKGHMVVHSEERPFACTLCNKSYKTKIMLNIHMRTHTKEKPFMCDVCGQSFALQTTLTYHSNRHTNARPYKCEVCGKGFNAHPGLRKHRQIHTGEKPYTCEVCGKKFIASNALKSHALTHTDLRPYSCSLCGKTFRNSGNLKYHMTHFHKR